MSNIGWTRQARAQLAIARRCLSTRALGPIKYRSPGDIRPHKRRLRLGKEAKSRVWLLRFRSSLKPAFSHQPKEEVLDAQAFAHACGCNPYCWLACLDGQRPNPGARRGDPEFSGAQRDLDPARRLRTPPVCGLPVGHPPLARPMRCLLSNHQPRI